MINLLNVTARGVPPRSRSRPPSSLRRAQLALARRAPADIAHAAGAQDDCEKAASCRSPIPGSRGTPQSPAGPIILVCDLSDSGQTQYLPAEPVAASGGRLVRLTGPREIHPAPSRPAPEDQPSHEYEARDLESPARDASPPDVPVTLTVELGRVNLTLTAWPTSRPGDVLELGRHSREPVELTSNGRLVARGELVLIDTELGVRVTHVFL